MQKLKTNYRLTFFWTNAKIQIKQIDLSAQTGKEEKDMKTSQDLRQLLNSVDHKSYPAYKSTQGTYDFGSYALSIDHVQGDPFASPSKVSVSISHQRAGYPSSCFENPWRKTAVEDYLVRQFDQEIARYNFKAKGSGKSGLIATSHPGPEILSRTACESSASGITARFEVGFPANGRTINAGELIKIFFDFLPRCVEQVFFYRSRKPGEVRAITELADDQQFIRKELIRRELVSFVADGAILPRESGVSSRPMKGGGSIPFLSPESLRVTMELPNCGAMTGMGIPRGITLIVGGGYHGKSTLLKALEAGVYNHIAGDGREYVITDRTAVKLRAEDGRSVRGVDISLFINDLPNHKDTRSFSTEDASGSTSQAAGVIEGIEAGSHVFLIDEDTSATNFMVRDDLMQKIISRDKEPITPFIERVRDLYEKSGISTVMVAGSSGAYFYIADTILQMDHYEPLDITGRTKAFCAGYGMEPICSAPGFTLPTKGRKLISNEKKAVPANTVQPNNRYEGNSGHGRYGGNRGSHDDHLKTKTFGKDSLQVGKETVDLRFVEQLADSEQTAALAQMLRFCVEDHLLERCSLEEAVDLLLAKVQKEGLTALDGHSYGAMGLCLPRRQEIFACLNRYRG